MIKYLTENSGLLQKLLPGDVVLADCGLTLLSRLAQFRPNYTFQLSQREKANCQLWMLKRPEVLPMSEHVIGCVKQKFPILQSTIPITFLSSRKCEYIPLIDHICSVRLLFPQQCMQFCCTLGVDV